MKVKKGKFKLKKRLNKFLKWCRKSCMRLNSLSSPHTHSTVCRRWLLGRLCLAISWRSSSSPHQERRSCIRSTSRAHFIGTSIRRRTASPWQRSRSSWAFRAPRLVDAKQRRIKLIGLRYHRHPLPSDALLMRTELRKVGSWQLWEKLAYKLPILRTTCKFMNFVT